MYATHNAETQKHAETPAGLVDVVSMVLLSIRQPWYSIGGQLADVRETRGASKFLFGHKRAGYLYAVKHSRELIAAVASHKAGTISTRELFREFLKVPGLGLAKAGFAVQLVAGVAGCMDSHNLTRFGIDAKFMRLPKLVDPARQIEAVDARIDAYLALVDASGGCAGLWDSWCDFIAARDPKNYANGEAVSACHVNFLA